MTVEIGDILRVAARGNVATIGDIVNVYHFRWDGGEALDDADAADHCANRVDKAMTACNAQISNDFTYLDVNVFNVTQLRPVGLVTWPTRTIGAHADETLPAQVSAFVRFPTGISKNWAKKFLGPFTSAANTAAGLIESATLTVLVAYAAEILSPTLGDAGDLMTAVVHYTKTNSWEDLQEAVVRNVWSTIRTRRAGRGS